MKIFYSWVCSFSLVFGQGLLFSQFIASGLDKPIYLTAPSGCVDTLYVVEQSGKIRTISNSILIKKPFLDITDRVHNPLFPGDERGLLGMAFHPRFYDNGYFYLNYISNDQMTIISRFSIQSKTTLEKSEEIILTIEQPYSNHNGGQLEFGYDGYLYIGVGDGGSAGDPFNNGQNNNTLLGSILRIDVNSSFPYSIPPSNPVYENIKKQNEIWLYGLRNPWRFSFDAKTNELYVGDVGQNGWEEIHLIPHEGGGSNLGWNIMEGNHCYPDEKLCDKTGLTLPIFEYPNDANYMKTLVGFAQTKPKIQGCSVTGGYIYRGALIPHFQGHYIFADYCTGKFWSFVYKDNKVTHFKKRTTELRDGTGKKQFYVSSFGKDGVGELYFLDYEGSVYKIINGLPK